MDKEKILVPQVVDEKFGKIRAITIAGEPLFVGRDVATILGYHNPAEALQDHVPAKFRRVINAKTLQQMASQSKGSDSLLLETTSPRGLTFIKEQGLYHLILRSNLPAAEEFTDWTCFRVIKDENGNSSLCYCFEPVI